MQGRTLQEAEWQQSVLGSPRSQRAGRGAAGQGGAVRAGAKGRRVDGASAPLPAPRQAPGLSPAPGIAPGAAPNSASIRFIAPSLTACPLPAVKGFTPTLGLRPFDQTPPLSTGLAQGSAAAGLDPTPTLAPRAPPPSAASTPTLAPPAPPSTAPSLPHRHPSQPHAQAAGQPCDPRPHGGPPTRATPLQGLAPAPAPVHTSGNPDGVREPRADAAGTAARANLHAGSGPPQLAASGPPPYSAGGERDRDKALGTGLGGVRGMAGEGVGPSSQPLRPPHPQSQSLGPWPFSPGSQVGGLPPRPSSPGSQRGLTQSHPPGLQQGLGQIPPPGNGVALLPGQPEQSMGQVRVGKWHAQGA